MDDEFDHLLQDGVIAALGGADAARVLLLAHAARINRGWGPYVRELSHDERLEARDEFLEAYEGGSEEDRGHLEDVLWRAADQLNDIVGLAQPVEPFGRPVEKAPARPAIVITKKRVRSVVRHRGPVTVHAGQKPGKLRGIVPGMASPNALTLEVRPSDLLHSPANLRVASFQSHMKHSDDLSIVKLNYVSKQKRQTVEEVTLKALANAAHTLNLGLRFGLSRREDDGKLKIHTITMS